MIRRRDKKKRLKEKDVTWTGSAALLCRLQKIQLDRKIEEGRGVSKSTAYTHTEEERKKEKLTKY